MKPALDSLIKSCKLIAYNKKRLLSSSLVTSSVRKSLSKRSFLSSAHKKSQNNTANNAVMDGNHKNQQTNIYSNALGYYGASLYNSISYKLPSTSGLSEKFFKEFDRYYKSLNEKLNLKNIDLFKSSDASDSSQQPNTKISLRSEKNNQLSPEGENSNKQPLHPIVLKDTKPQDLFKQFAITSKRLITTEEKVVNLSQALEKSTSMLIRQQLVVDLYKLLYNDPEACYVVNKKQKQLIITLLNLRQLAEEKREKMLNGNINQCLALIGYVDNSSIKHANVNILTLDVGGKPSIS